MVSARILVDVPAARPIGTQRDEARFDVGQGQTCVGGLCRRRVSDPPCTRQVSGRRLVSVASQLAIRAAWREAGARQKGHPYGTDAGHSSHRIPRLLLTSVEHRDQLRRDISEDRAARHEAPSEPGEVTRCANLSSLRLLHLVVIRPLRARAAARQGSHAQPTSHGTQLRRSREVGVGAPREPARVPARPW